MFCVAARQVELASVSLCLCVSPRISSRVTYHGRPARADVARTRRDTRITSPPPQTNLLPPFSRNVELVGHETVQQFVKLPTLLIAAALLNGGCAEVPQPTTPTPPARPATQAVLKDIELRSGIYLARFETYIRITPDGRLRSVFTNNKSYGPNDTDPRHERREVREGRLTPRQMADLASLFAGWESLSSTYSAAADDQETTLRYGAKTVSGGRDLPHQVRQVQHRIHELTATMPVVSE